jgi:hypothetical protein
MLIELIAGATGYMQVKIIVENTYVASGTVVDS